MEYKNRSGFGKPSAQQYNMSFYPSLNNRTKEEETNLLSNLQSDNEIQWKKINLAQVVKKNKVQEFIRDSVISNGFHSAKHYSTITTEFSADMIFFDFDEGDLTYDNALEILKKSELNFILTTSKSYSSKKEKLHIIVPALKTITSHDEYKYMFKELYKQLFDRYNYDRAVTNTKSVFFTPDNNTMRFDYEFSKNDFHIDFSLSDKQAFKETTKARERRYNKNDISLDKEAFEDFSK